MAVTGKLPEWLKPVNRVVMLLQRLGLRLGTIHVISIPGRVSGQVRSTPVSLLTVDGQRYIIGGLAQADWVKNARAARCGVLSYGRRQERVALIELPVEESKPILRAFPREVPQGVQFFQRVYSLPHDRARLPEAFAALAGRALVFRVEPITALATPTASAM